MPMTTAEPGKRTKGERTAARIMDVAENLFAVLNNDTDGVDEGETLTLRTLSPEAVSGSTTTFRSHFGSGSS